MTTALCTPEAVLKRLGDLDLPDSEVGMIVEAIEDASDAARDYGSPTWGDPLVPKPVERLVALAVARFMRNPDDYLTNRASDEALGWAERDRIDWFTEAEISRLGRMGRPMLANFGSIQIVAYGHRPRRPRDVRVPWGTDPRDETFPLDSPRREGSGTA